jgi:hypothetical protein
MHVLIRVTTHNNRQGVHSTHNTPTSTIDIMFGVSVSNDPETATAIAVKNKNPRPMTT